MRRRLKNYVAVVMSLLLCLGVWFQHGQMVKAEDEILATIIISTGAEADIYLEGIPVKGFSSVTTEDGMTTYVGSLSLTQEQIEAVDADERYLMYWYATDDRMEDDTIAVGTSPAIDLSRLFAEYITCEEITGEDGSVTYDRLTITLFASYGASHKVAYDSNYQMGGYINSSVSDVIAEKVYYQADSEITEENYDHPSTPIFNGATWTNTVSVSNSDNTTREIDYFFTGWGNTDSGGVNAPSVFEYEDMQETTATFYAQWQKPCELTVNYYMTEAEMQLQKPYYDPVTVLQESLDDTSLTFTTMQGAEMDGEFFAAWQYEDESGAAVTLAENEEKTIAIPQDGTDVILNLYGLWSPAAKLQVTYDQGDMFDPYTVEVQQASISDTTFSFETSRDAAPPTDYSIFEGWSYTNASGATVIIGAGETCSDIPITTTAVTMTAVWKEPLLGGSTVSAGTHTLLEGESYTLGSGSWTVTYGGSGDSCTYTGGSTFYVTSTGDYTFTAK